MQGKIETISVEQLLMQQKQKQKRAINIEFVAKMIGTYPSLIWQSDENETDIFGLAILSCQVEMFNLIHEIRGWKKYRTA